MSSSRPQFDATTEDQAALWAARLEGSSLSAEARVSLDAWLAENPGHRTLLSSYCQFSADLERKLPALIAAGGVAMPEKAPPRRRMVSSWLAGGAFTAAAAAFVVWLALPAAPAGKFATSVSQRQTVTLEDGTRVELNARTNLLVLKSDTERRVRLVEGEAFFKVTKDKSRPFIVETSAGSVRVTGTQFDVRSEDSAELVVTVAEGSVQVRPGDSAGVNLPDPVALLAGDQVAVRGDGAPVKRALSSADVGNVLAWREGIAVFDDTPLRDAVAKFARYHGRKITVTEGAGSLKVTLRFGLDDLDGFLASLTQAFPVRFTLGANGAIRVSLKNEP